MKPIKISITRKGDINRAITLLKEYKHSLSTKGEIFVRRLAEIGIPIIDSRIAHANGDSDPDHYTYIELNSFGEYSEARLIVEGQDIAFFEFGAGVHFNGGAGSSSRPSKEGSMNGADYSITGGQELGYTIGSYGKGQGKEDHWFYQAETGEAIMSHGTEATMPLYHATLEILNSIEQIAREVYGNG